MVRPDYPVGQLEDWMAASTSSEVSMMPMVRPRGQTQTRGTPRWQDARAMARFATSMGEAEAGTAMTGARYLVPRASLATTPTGRPWPSTTTVSLRSALGGGAFDAHHTVRSTVMHSLTSGAT